MQERAELPEVPRLAVGWRRRSIPTAAAAGARVRDVCSECVQVGCAEAALRKRRHLSLAAAHFGLEGGFAYGRRRRHSRAIRSMALLAVLREERAATLRGRGILA